MGQDRYEGGNRRAGTAGEQRGARRETETNKKIGRHKPHEVETHCSAGRWWELAADGW